MYGGLFGVIRLEIGIKGMRMCAIAKKLVILSYKRTIDGKSFQRNI